MSKKEINQLFDRYEVIVAALKAAGSNALVCVVVSERKIVVTEVQS